MIVSKFFLMVRKDCKSGIEVSNYLVQVCGYIHAISHQYVAALDSYIKATLEPIHAFSFIYDMLRQFDNEEHDAFESAVISRIPDLIKLSRLCFYYNM